MIRIVASRVFAAAAALSIAACAHAPAAAPRAPADRLDQTVAEARAARIADISYAIDIDLVADPDAYSGEVVATFTLAVAPTAPLTLDFGGGTVESVAVNGAAIEADYNGAFITLPASALRAGANRVEVAYRHAYANDGNGLHHFVDPADGETYLYTYLWPYYANRLFPAFDQPDLKARYALTVRAPASWTVISASSPQEITTEGEAPGAPLVWRFAETPPFSTYIMSLHAGPYAVWEGDADGIPIRLFARRSLAPYVNAEEWLAVTRAGLAFYQSYFDIPYPFGKYDQVLTPDFNIGAMENVAAVTFNENYVRRGDESEAFRRRRAGTILHEMAHMWFGDLVTKKWWNDLWLNESFATFMSSLAVPAATDFGDVDHDFFLDNTLRGLAADGRVTTHPIETPVPSTDDFYGVFDQITYGKGASVLRQLEYLVGADAFRTGVSAYLKEHAYSNTTLEDFMSAIAEASGRDLDDWSRDWLYAAGPNTLAAEFACADGAVTSFAVTQSAPTAHPTLRTHKTAVVLYADAPDGSVVARDIMEVEVSGRRTAVPAAVGLACPALVFPNHRDHDYAVAALDPATRAGLADRTARIADPLARSMFWRALRVGSETDAASVAAYLDLAVATLPGETDVRVRDQVIGDVVALVARLERAAPAGDGLLAANRERLEALTWAGLADPARDVSARAAWFNAHAALARSDAALDRLEGVLDARADVAGFAVDQDRRWRILRTLAEAGRADAPARIAAEAAGDASDAGEQAAIAAEAALPDGAVKDRWLAAVVNDADLPLSRKRTAMGALFPSNQEALHAARLDAILAGLPRGADPYFTSAYVQALLGGVCDAAGRDRLDAAAEDAAGLDSTARRFLREAAQGAAGCVAFREALAE